MRRAVGRYRSSGTILASALCLASLAGVLPGCQANDLLGSLVASLGSLRGGTPHGSSLVVGSVNADIIMEVDRLPTPGETLTSRNPKSGRMIPGGKGANQAVALARLCKERDSIARDSETRAPVKFACQFGNDQHAKVLEQALKDDKLDLSACGHVADYPSGQGYVFLQGDGSVSAIVVGGANMAWPSKLCELENAARGASALLLQCEVPECVNEAVASAAAQKGVPVILDVGGEDRPMSDTLLKHVTYISLNLSELARLTGMPTNSEDAVLAAAKSLQVRGARNVLITLGDQGSVLLCEGGELLKQGCCPVPGGKVVDATAAGDAYRAAFVSALVEGCSLEECMQWGSAAGAICVSRLGAIPSLPFREEMLRLRKETFGDAATKITRAASTSPVDAVPSTGSGEAQTGTIGLDGTVTPLESMKFGSRLNSMKDRLDLWDGPNDVFGWVARQGTIKGLDLVDFNYPQHLENVPVADAREALFKAGLKAGALCMRYPKKFQAGAFTNPNPVLRQEAIELTKEAGQWARDLGAEELVVWSAFDGYDYNNQVDYLEKWRQVVNAFQEVCDAYPDIKVSLEFKATDENTRFFIVPSTGAALQLVEDINRPNMGLTLDVGHCLMAGENPAQSCAMVGSKGKLFGIQLNDGTTRLAAEDGLMFGSVHPLMALEFVRWLQKTNFKGHVYFDTFPRNEDPVREAEFNIRRFKAMWKRASRLSEHGVDDLLANHDAMRVLELLEEIGEI